MTMPDKMCSFEYTFLINDLIQKIDAEESLFKVTDELYGQKMTLINLILLFVSAGIIWIIPSLSYYEKIAVSIAIIALIATFFPVISHNLEKRIIDANIRKALKKFNIKNVEEEKRIFLEALIKIKAEKPQYKLAIIREIHPEIFTKENLLEKLFEVRNSSR